MPPIVGSVGMMTMDEQPISGATSTRDSMHPILENTASSWGLAEMRSRVVLTTLLSTLQTLPIAVSETSTLLQYACPSLTLIPLDISRDTTFCWDGKPPNSFSKRCIRLHIIIQ